MCSLARRTKMTWDLFLAVFTHCTYLNVEGIKIDLNKLGNFMVKMGDKDNRFTRIENHMECLYKCSVSPGCKFFSANYVPEDPTTTSDFKCTLSSNPTNDTELYGVVDTCEDKANYVWKYPTAIAGACADHKCGEGQQCSVKKEGGYKCIRARGRSAGKKGKGRMFKIG